MASHPALKHNPIIPVLALLWIGNPGYGKFLWNDAGILVWVCGLVWDHQTHLLLSVKPGMNHRSLGWKFALLTPWVTQLPRQRLSAMSNSITKASATRNPNPFIRTGAGKPQTGHINNFPEVCLALSRSRSPSLALKGAKLKIVPQPALPAQSQPDNLIRTVPASRHTAAILLSSPCVLLLACPCPQGRPAVQEVWICH